MSQYLILKCECGSLTGKVRGASAKSVNRLVCHCTDCQAFARYLGAPERVLDPNGGSDICQTSMARVSIDQGKEHLAVMRLSPKGLLRWHSRCCRTVIANTMAKTGLPFCRAL